MTETSYIKICAYALIPCLLFYTGIFTGIHAKALQLNLRPVPDDLIPSWKSVLTWHKLAPLLIPATILMWLLIKGYILMRAGFYACLAVIIIHVFSDFSFSGIRERTLQMIKALSEGGKQVSKIVPVLVCLNVFTVVLGLTGVAPKISELILQIGGQTLFGALLFSAIVPLALGTALPVAATYILSVAVIASGLIKVGIDMISVHMFLFYWSTLASITPPTCVPAVIAANIGGGNWLKVAFSGMKLGFVAFLIPFFYVIDPGLLGRGVPMYVFERVISGFIGTIFVSFGIFGYCRSNLTWVLRLIYAVGGVFLLYPNTQISIIGLAIVIFGFILESLMLKRKLRTLDKATKVVEDMVVSPASYATQAIGNASEEKIKQLYETAEKIGESPSPKRGLFGSKCPSCGKRLRKDSAEKTIYSGEDGSEFAKKVTDKAGLTRGVYILSIEHFSCQSCNYQFAKVEVKVHADDD